MASIRIGRQAVTPKGVDRRVADLEFDRVSEPRDAGKVKFDLSTLLSLLVLAAASGARSMREVELRSEQLRPSTRAVIDLDERVADNTLGLLLRRLEPEELRWALYRQVKTEKRRGNLDHTALPWNTVAIDGKHVTTLPWHALVAATRSELRHANDKRIIDDPEWMPSKDEVRQLFSTRFPYVQLVQPPRKDEALYGLIRVHRSTLISSGAAVCVDERPIAGDSNEIGTIVASIEELLHAYRPTNLVQMVTMDAGNTSLEVASLLRKHGVQYFMAVKSPQGELHAEAERVFGRPERTADFAYSEDRAGRTVAYEGFIEPLPAGFLGWTHARSLVRVHRVTMGDEPDDVTEGNRYYVCSLGSDELTAKGALQLSRAHWRCENNGHWTSDAILDEDARQAPWTRHPKGVLVASQLRMIAQNVLAVFRALSRIRTSDRRLVTPTWKAVIQHFLVLLFEPLLDTTAFDA